MGLVYGYRLKSLAICTATIFAIAAILTALSLLFHTAYLSETHKVEVLKESIRQEQGCAYIVPLSNAHYRTPFTILRGQGGLYSPPSDLVLYADGIALPQTQAHSTHDLIRIDRAGLKYSHWKNSLYFSAKDCADPRTNQVIYSISAQALLSDTAIIFLFLFWAGVAVLLYRTASKHTRFVKGTERLIGFISHSLQPSLHHSKLALLVLFLLVFALAAAVLFYLWARGQTIDLAVAGFYQISDASGYWVCANSLLYTGTIADVGALDDWCLRRPLYSILLSGLALMADQNIFDTLLLQAFLLVGAFFILARRLAFTSGVLSAAIVFVLLFIYAAGRALPLTMTENAGLLLGSLATACAVFVTQRLSNLQNAPLQSIELNNRAYYSVLGWLFLSVFLFATALNARAGAMLFMPALVLWSGCLAYMHRRSCVLWVSVALCAIAANVLIQKSLLTFLGGDAAQMHGNFSYVLYGLATGGTGWSQVLIDYPALHLLSDGEKSAKIYSYALERFMHDPWLWLQGVAKNFNVWLAHGTLGYHNFSVLGHILQLFWLLGLVVALRNSMRSGYHLLLALAALANFGSALFILSDGGARIFAATIVFDVMLIAIGFCFLLAWLIRSSNLLSPSLNQSQLFIQMPSQKLEKIYLFLVLLLLIAPFAPSASGYSRATLPNFESVATQACASGEREIITQFTDYGAQYLSVLSGAEASSVQGAAETNISKENLIARTSPNSWWRDDLIAFTGGGFALVFNYDYRSDTFMTYNLLYSTNQLTPMAGHWVRVCIDSGRSVSLFDAPYQAITNIEPIAFK